MSNKEKEYKIKIEELRINKEVFEKEREIIKLKIDEIEKSLKEISKKTTLNDFYKNLYSEINMLTSIPRSFVDERIYINLNSYSGAIDQDREMLEKVLVEYKEIVKKFDEKIKKFSDEIKK
ncbi:hypothetical protein [Peptostreptococcus faecalis]|uniref:hypothetical protein n=1 Tax=Peptostreptococcus faecalis TaxID=2045015 RepID=UPI000C7C99A7|nr:hypothetical protein [Peptostreptococcus faecalis]